MLGANTIFCGEGLAMDCLNPFFLFLWRKEPIIGLEECVNLKCVRVANAQEACY